MGVVSERVRPFFVPENVCAGRFQAFPARHDLHALLNDALNGVANDSAYSVGLYARWNKKLCKLQSSLCHLE